MTPEQAWPIIAGCAAVVYGAGHIVGRAITKIQNGKYQHKDLCEEKHKNLDQRLASIEAGVNRIWKHISGEQQE